MRDQLVRPTDRELERKLRSLLAQSAPDFLRSFNHPDQVVTICRSAIAVLVLGGDADYEQTLARLQRAHPYLGIARNEFDQAWRHVKGVIGQ